MAGLNQKEYAAHRGVSAPYINKLVKQGAIPIGADGKIDPNAADRALAAQSDPGKAGVVASNASRRGTAAPSAPPATPPTKELPAGDALTPVGPFHRAKTVDAEYAAKLRELDYRQRIGSLIDRDAYAKGCEDAAVALGKELDNMIHRLANITGQRELIAAEVFRARDAMADTLEALAADPRNGTRQ